MKKEIICTVCPRGCAITVEGADGKVLSIEGNGCKRGLAFAESEFTAPVRLLTSTVRVAGRDGELLPVRTRTPILRDKLFDVLDIDASFAGGDLQNPELLATLYRGYSVEQSVGTQESFHLEETPGENSIYYAGGLTISAEDLAKLVALLANDGVYQHRQLMQSESVALMETYCKQPLEDGTFQALPLLYVPWLYGRRGIYFHSGAAYGIYSCISYDPETGDGVVVLTSGASTGSQHYDIYDVCDEINKYIYGILR